MFLMDYNLFFGVCLEIRREILRVLNEEPNTLTYQFLIDLFDGDLPSNINLISLETTHSGNNLGMDSSGVVQAFVMHDAAQVNANLSGWGMINMLRVYRPFGNALQGRTNVGGTGGRQPIQTINNRFPNSNQTGKRFNYTIRDGRIQTEHGVRNVDFVVDMNGNLHIGRGHSFLANGQPVQAAGTLKLNGQGRVMGITNASGHYQPTVAQAGNFPQLLNNAGVNTSGSWLTKYTITTTPSGYVNLGQLEGITILLP